MDIANFISLKLGFIDIKLYQDIKLMLKKLCEGVPLGKISITDFEKALARDKKNIGNTYHLILSKGIGNMLKHGVKPSKTFTIWLNEYFSN